MDEKQKAGYLKSPNRCPYCNSDKIVGLEFKIESSTQIIECPDCGRQWTDVYTLTDVEQIEAKSL